MINSKNDIQMFINENSKFSSPFVQKATPLQHNFASKNLVQTKIESKSEKKEKEILNEFEIIQSDEQNPIHQFFENIKNDSEVSENLRTDVLSLLNTIKGQKIFSHTFYILSNKKFKTQEQFNIIIQILNCYLTCNLKRYITKLRN